jgi:cysteine-rich repeat protein
MPRRFLAPFGLFALLSLAFSAHLACVPTPDPECGDRRVDDGEECDDGNEDNSDLCTNACLTARCGDGLIQGQTGEACDDANDSDSDACLTSCKSAKCGDGLVQEGVEECDDGNVSSADTCLTTCLLNTCGDGKVNAESEECDDGNLLNTDACLTSCTTDDGADCCKRSACGDGTLQTQLGEQCDDGNIVSTDACTAECRNAACGDGVIREGYEECDDGNLIDTDVCRANCKLSVCGDSFKQDDEECDDGNVVSGDFCSSDCKKECSFGTAAFSADMARCFVYMPSFVNWAQPTCESFQMLKARILTSGDNDVVKSLVPPQFLAPWTGGNDSLTPNFWVWAGAPGEDPTFIFYENWAAGEPDALPGGAANCVTIDSTGSWHTEDCADLRPLVCEYIWP